MAILGCLSEFSLAELFQFLEQGQKTGLLTIRSQPHPHTGTMQNYHIWFSQGRILGAANRLDNQGLARLIIARGWLNQHLLSRIFQVRNLSMPLGAYLKSQGLLKAEQLKLLFTTQVLRQVCSLFTLPDGSFEFNSSVSPPLAEMTGLSIPANDVTLAGLRALQNWTNLQDKLPDPTSALVNCVQGKPRLRLDKLEWQVWEFTNGTISIAEIAEHLRLSVETIQRIAFRLVVVDLVEEVPMILADAPLQENTWGEVSETDNGNISQSFLHNLVGFLRNKV